MQRTRTLVENIGPNSAVVYRRLGSEPRVHIDARYEVDVVGTNGKWTTVREYDGKNARSLAVTFAEGVAFGRTGEVRR